jgi:hypothetical protein
VEDVVVLFAERRKADLTVLYCSSSKRATLLPYLLSKLFMCGVVLYLEILVVFIAKC